MFKKMLLALCAMSSIAFSAQAIAQEAPDKMIRRITEEVMAAVQTDKKVQNGDRRSIQKIIEEKILPNLDFERTTALAAGRYWRDATPEQKQRLETEFRTLLIYTYSSAMSQLRDQKVEYDPFRADPADTDVEVFAHTVNTRGEPVRFGYRLIKKPDGWKVYDVNVLGAWMVQAYKDSFGAEIRKSGIDGLIKTLADKNAKLAANPPTKVESTQPPALQR
ncbi:MAG TPA: ABC transporter substrate-binding protein [Oxalicibacterium sp.]|nr:ABC transporter substrate-binding protein [Oxalicibacterium sp.]